MPVNSRIDYITATYIHTNENGIAVIGQPDSPVNPNVRKEFSVVLFADVHGYSRLMDQDELDTIERVAHSINLIKQLIGDYGGMVLNIAGDGVLATFSQPDKAVNFAVELQRELKKGEVWNSEKEPIHFRIGIAAGKTYMRDEVLHGNSVNLAARLQELAQPGGICISDRLLQQLENKDEYLIESIGKHALKNIYSPIQIFTVAPSDHRNSGFAGDEIFRAVDTVDNSGNGQHEVPDASLAVLPLDNMTTDPSDDHLCHGIVSDIISNLSRFRKITITARHSAFVVVNQTSSIRDIGRRLGVRYIMTGGLRRVGRKLRINVELVECETENVVWSERYDGTLDDIFEFEEEVSNTAASRLVVQIDLAEQKRFRSENIPSIDAYGYILRGEDINLSFRPESNFHARRLFVQARDLDPQYGRSYAAISRTFNVEWRYSWSTDREAALQRALQLARTAVEYDSLDARGYSELGLALLYSKQHDESVDAYNKALKINPNDADLLAEAADCFVYVGEPGNSVKMLHRAIRLNPYHPDEYLWYLGDAYFHLGDYEQTINTLLKMRDQSEGQRLMASSYALLGELKKARYHAKQVMKAHPNFTIEDWRQVPPNKNPEDLEKFVHGLRLSGLN